MSFLSKDIGIDLGTTKTMIYVKGKGIVLREPSVVAINAITNEVLAVGDSAKEMLGRTPDNILALKPLRRGVIANFYATKMMLEKFINKVVEKNFFNKPRVVVCVPADVTDVEERAVEEVVYSCGAREVYVMEEAMAAAIGAGLKIDGPEGSMIVDIGGGTTEIAVMSLGGIVSAKSIRLGGDDIDRDIIEYIKTKRNVMIGEAAAEETKMVIGAAYSSMTEERMQVKGRELTTGLPVTITVCTSEIQEAMQRVIEEILRNINETFENTPPELAADVMVNGIVLSGGGAGIKNIDRYINSVVGIPVHIANNPLDCVIRGAGIALNNIDMLKKAAKKRKF